MKKGKQISLKKWAVPSIYADDSSKNRVDDLIICDENQENEAAEIVLKTVGIESLQKQLEEEKERNQKLQQEIDIKNEHIQNLTHDLNTFKMNLLAQFAVTASQDVKVKYSLLPLF